MISSDQSTRIQSDTSAVVHNVVDSFSGDNQEYVGHDSPQHLIGDRDVSQLASSLVSLCSNCTDERLNEGEGGYIYM